MRGGRVQARLFIPAGWDVAVNHRFCHVMPPKKIPRTKTSSKGSVRSWQSSGRWWKKRQKDWRRKSWSILDSKLLSYGWWFRKSCNHQLRVCSLSPLFTGLYTSKRWLALGFLPPVGTNIWRYPGLKNAWRKWCWSSIKCNAHYKWTIVIPPVELFVTLDPVGFNVIHFIHIFHQPPISNLRGRLKLGPGILGHFSTIWMKRKVEVFLTNWRVHSCATKTLPNLVEKKDTSNSRFQNQKPPFNSYLSEWMYSNPIPNVPLKEVVGRKSGWKNPQKKTLQNTRKQHGLPLLGVHPIVPWPTSPETWGS